MGEQVLTKLQQAEKIISEFIESELGDYSFTWLIEPTSNPDDDRQYFDIKYGLGDERNNWLKMRVDTTKEHENIEIDMHDDSWEVVETFSYRIKYFWMKVIWE